jgi:hypothetical protein
VAAFIPVRIAAGILGDGLWDVPMVIAGLGLFALFLRAWLPDHYSLVSEIMHQMRGGLRKAQSPTTA